MILDREQRASDLATKADRDISPKLTDEQYHALLHYTPLKPVLSIRCSFWKRLLVI